MLERSSNNGRGQEGRSSACMEGRLDGASLSDLEMDRAGGRGARGRWWPLTRRWGRHAGVQDDDAWEAILALDPWEGRATPPRWEGRLVCSDSTARGKGIQGDSWCRGATTARGRRRGGVKAGVGLGRRLREGRSCHGASGSRQRAGDLTASRPRRPSIVEVHGGSVVVHRRQP